MFDFDFDFDFIVEFVNSNFIQLKTFDFNIKYHEFHLKILNFLQTFAKFRDYAIRIKRSKRHKISKSNQQNVMYVMCFKKNKIVFFTIKKRKHIFFRMIECFFNIVTREKNNVWNTNIICENHNHEKIHVKIHFVQRKIEMIFEITKRIKTIMKFDRNSKNLFDKLKFENFNCIINIKNIYNVKNEFKIEMFKNLIFTQVLFMMLKNRNRWFHRIQKNSITNWIQRFFFANMQISKKKFVRNYEIFIMNCTYKTNKYKLFLFVIVDHICINITFYANFCFLFDEIQKNYAWTFEQIHQFYQQFKFFKSNVYVTNCDTKLFNVFAIHNSRAKVLLCLWHIEMNINKQCKKYFDIEKIWIEFMRFWRNVINNHIVVQYNDNWKTFEIKYIIFENSTKNDIFFHRILKTRKSSSLFKKFENC